ncbi:hypothetical protein [Arthrobacter sp. A2-55]|uniref:hypothetical protein n=1 Tax=Arthrobacter sp. A2-55 TaxID=2897337 RepID=UPI0021CD8C7F|nr:hypothetical protein [Arthrobacter sp. A2-55]MCU6480184.1 hypothetical protein [Arthrobacter sp. A2-55]
MTNYSKNPGSVRLDLFAPDGSWHSTEALDMTDFHDAGQKAEAAVHRAMSSAGITLAEGWKCVVLDPYHRQGQPVLIQQGSGSDKVSAEPPAAVNELLSTLDLYLGRYEWLRLDSSQRELFADAIDAHYAASNDAEEHRKDRWWRDDSPVAQEEPTDQDLDGLLVQFAAELAAHRRFAAMGHRGLTFAEWNQTDPDFPRTLEFSELTRSMSEMGMLAWPLDTAEDGVLWTVEAHNRTVPFGADCRGAVEYVNRMRRKRERALLSWSFQA